MINGWRVRGLWSGFAVAAVVSCVLVLHRPAFDRLADLQVYDGAVRFTRAGGSLYDFAAGDGDPFTYPPFAAVVFWPMSWLPLRVIQVIWLGAVCAATAAIALALAMRTAPGAPQHFLPIMDLGDGQRVFYFSGTNLRYGQFLAYDAHGRLIQNPPPDLWK